MPFEVVRLTYHSLITTRRSSCGGWRLNLAPRFFLKRGRRVCPSLWRRCARREPAAFDESDERRLRSERVPSRIHRQPDQMDVPHRICSSVRGPMLQPGGGESPSFVQSGASRAASGVSQLANASHTLVSMSSTRSTCIATRNKPPIASLDECGGAFAVMNHERQQEQIGSGVERVKPAANTPGRRSTAEFISSIVAMRIRRL